MKYQSTELLTTVNQFKVTEIWLKISGIWPDEPHGNVLRIFWAVDMLVMQASQFAFLLSCFKVVDWVTWIDIFGLFMLFTIILLKLCLLWLGKSIFQEILIRMRNDIHESFSTNRGVNIILKKLEISDYCCKLILYFIVSCGFFYVLLFLVISVYYTSSHTTSSTNEKLLLYSASFPFDKNKSPYYEFIIVFQIFNTILVSAISASTFCLILVLVLHVGGQIEIINEELMNISSSESKQDITGIISRIIEKHQKAIYLSKKIESLFSNIAMLQFIINTLAICISCFIIIITITTDFTFITLMKFAMYYVVSNLEVLVLCYAGEYLSNKSLTVVDAIYNSCWYNLNRSDNQLLLLMTLRAQHQFVITAAKFITLSLQCFSKITRTSASYLSLLLAIYS
ncbi:odorant receptor 82a-like [Prorops nasuta]|uniref:odorant receptor 82a-like n=1 Tax=Prorops nasuta TaxID=863751 RepID=UPI0034CFAE7F